MAWDRQFDLSSGSGTAPRFESCVDSFGPFSHAQEPPVSLASRPQYSTVDPAAVVADEYPQTLGRMVDFHFDAACSGVAERIYQRFAAYTVDFISDEWMQWPGPSFRDNTKINLIFDGEFLLDPGKSLFEIVRTARRRAQASKYVSALFNHIPH